MSASLEQGVRHKHIYTDAGKIIDGWNRHTLLRALQQQGKAEDARLFYQPIPEGHDAATFVLALNLHRRHLSASQRAGLVAAVHAEAGKDSAEYSAPPIREQARAAQVDEKTMRQATAAEANGRGEDVVKGTISASAAAREYPAPKSDTPKGPTKVERLLAELDEAKLDLKEKVDKIEDLEYRLRFVMGESSDLDHEREAVFNALRASESAAVHTAA